MELNYLPIKRKNIEFRPDQFSISISGQQLIFRTSWNPVAEAFFFDLFDNEGNPIISGRRIVYAQNMLENIPESNFTNVSIVPIDPSGENDRTGITLENFMREIKPWIIEAGE